MSEPKNQEWIDIKDAAKRLGRGWGRNTIKRRIDKGQLKEGIHYRDDRLPDAGTVFLSRDELKPSGG